MGRPWRLIRSGPGAPAWNLACDRALLESADPRPVLRLYAWEPAALSLGHFQPLEPFLGPARAAGVPVVRRPTGGGAIHHDQELTFCLVARPGEDGYPADVVGAYRWVHQLVAGALESLGAALAFRGDEAPLSVRPRDASLCFEETTAMDLVDRSGRKVVGSAQRRSHGRVMHHGSIPLTRPSLSPGSGSLEELLERPVSWEQVAESLVERFATSGPAGGLVPDTLTAAERQAIDGLLAGGFADPGGR